jgi:hypothetical protein
LEIVSRWSSGEAGDGKREEKKKEKKRKKGKSRREGDGKEPRIALLVRKDGCVADAFRGTNVGAAGTRDCSFCREESKRRRIIEEEKEEVRVSVAYSRPRKPDGQHRWGGHGTVGKQAERAREAKHPP